MSLYDINSKSQTFHPHCKICKAQQSRGSSVLCSLTYNTVTSISCENLDGPRQAILTDKFRKGACVYNPEAYHLPVRDEIIAWLRGIANKLGYNPVTYHLGVYLLDGLLSYFDVSNKMIKLATYIAINLAAKLEECYTKIPTMCSVIELFNYEYTMEELTGFETHFFSAFDYYVNRKTVYTEIQMIMDRGVLFCSDFDHTDTPDSIQTKLLLFKSTLNKLTAYVTSVYELYSYDPKLVAMVLVSLARKSAGLSQWPYELKYQKEVLINGAVIRKLLEPCLQDTTKGITDNDMFDNTFSYKVDQSARASICKTELEFIVEGNSDDGSDTGARK